MRLLCIRCLVAVGLVLLCAVVGAAAAAAAAAATPHGKEPLAVVGVGSCNKPAVGQNFWPTIGATLRRMTNGLREAWWVWLGDVVYADVRLVPGVWVPNSPEGLREKYDELRVNEKYREFTSSSVRRVVGVWDDHDFGVNDGGGGDNPHRDVAQRLFLDLLGEPADSPLRAQRGLYSFHTVPFLPHVGAEHHALAQEFESALCVMLLDVRYFRDPVSATRDGDILGEQQWQWLRGVLRQQGSSSSSSSNSNSDDENVSGGKRKKKKKCFATLIGSGIQVISDALPTEHWGNFPAARTRLFRELRSAGVERAAFLSGDVHFGEMLEDNTTRVVDDLLGYPAVEMTTSGLTHSNGENVLMWTFFDALLPSQRRVGAYLLRNFGTVELRGSRGAPPQSVELVFRVHRVEDGSVALERVVPASRLSFKNGEAVPRKYAKNEGDFPDSAKPALTRFVLLVHEGLLPSLKRHNIIYGVLFGASAAIGVAIIAAARWVSLKLVNMRH